MVKLKLEKGYKYGDVILGGEIPAYLGQGIEHVDKALAKEHEERLGLSMANEIKKEKKLKIVCSSASIADEYRKVPGNDEFLTEAETPKSAVTMACDSAFDNDLTICHVDVGDYEGEKRWQKLAKLTKRMSNHTSQNGIFISVWSGSEDQNALVGLRFNKEEVKLAF